MNVKTRLERESQKFTPHECICGRKITYDRTYYIIVGRTTAGFSVCYPICQPCCELCIYDDIGYGVKITDRIKVVREDHQQLRKNLKRNW